MHDYVDSPMVEEDEESQVKFEFELPFLGYNYDHLYSKDLLDYPASPSSSDEDVFLELQQASEYMKKLYTCVKLMLSSRLMSVYADRPIFRRFINVSETNKFGENFFYYPTIDHEKMATNPPKDAIDLYWEISRNSYMTKMLVLQNFMDMEPERFLSWPESMPTQEDSFYNTSVALHSPTSSTSESSFQYKYNNDASRKSRIKKKITTELMYEYYRCDKYESDILDEEEVMLHFLIALLEDLVIDLTNNIDIIYYYREICCLK